MAGLKDIMRKVLFIFIFFTKSAMLLGYGTSAQTLEVFKKAEKIKKLFKENKSDKWMYRFDNQKHIFLWHSKRFSFKRGDIVLIVHNKNNLDKINIKSLNYCSFNESKVCLEINGNYSNKNLLLLLHTDVSDIYYDKENNDTLEIFKAK